jgi:hypothetical protein
LDDISVVATVFTCAVDSLAFYNCAVDGGKCQVAFASKSIDAVFELRSNEDKTQVGSIVYLREEVL